MNATLESVELIQTINSVIRDNGCCLISGSRLDLIFGGASDFGLKMHRLRSFARQCDWVAEPLNQGRAALFYPRRPQFRPTR